MVKYQCCTLNELRDEDRPGDVWVYLGKTRSDGEYHLIRRAGSSQCRLVKVEQLSPMDFQRDPHFDTQTEELFDEPAGRTPESPEAARLARW